jgi:hypothetical protein
LKQWATFILFFIADCQITIFLIIKQVSEFNLSNVGKRFIITLLDLGEPQNFSNAQRLTRTLGLHTCLSVEVWILTEVKEMKGMKQNDNFTASQCL